ncbi:MAG: class I SAM-dependent methyltransferase [Verrucomicrobia bacterium]|nr:class I SAM-dependent methyltransferase [Verrucomicrobiota bacterium]MBI3871353.1 class I SAM-dependent methyltransferase [Verrucomicrobiota bacterium]
MPTPTPSCVRWFSGALGSGIAFWLLSPLALLAADLAPPTAPVPRIQSPDRYVVRAQHDPNGIGKFYMGREIAHVMGHPAADWLERSSREEEERTSRLVELLRVRPGDTVADIGSGTGYLTRRIAPLAGPSGKVYGVDIQPEMLQLMTNQLSRLGITNVVAVLGTEKDPKLPAGALDLVVMVDVYHEFEFPLEMTEAMVKALKPGGRLAFVEFRAEDPTVPIKAVHKLSESQVKKEMLPHALAWEETNRELPWQHLIVFRKRKP